MSHSRVVGAVEIGTSKVAVVIGEITGGDSLNILGHLTCSSKGVRKGVIEDLHAASDCVHAGILTLERSSNTQIEEIYLSQTGRHLAGIFNIGSTSISGPDRVVRSGDVEQAKEDARRRRLPEDRTYIHHIQNPFLIDGREERQPLHRQGERLEVGYWSIHGASRTVTDSLRVIGGLDMDVTDIIVSSIASAGALLEESEKENGALVIDIGGGTSDWALYRKGYIVRTGVVPVGGDHVTNDLSIGLRVGRKSAEVFKTTNGRAYSKNEDKEERVWLYGDFTIGDREFPRAAITRIIEARVTEILEIVKGELEEAGLYRPADLSSGVVITGGSSRLEGIDEAARRVFGCESSVGEGMAGLAEDLRQPEYSTVMGLLHYALNRDEDEAQPMERVGILRRLTGFLNLK